MSHYYKMDTVTQCPDCAAAKDSNIEVLHELTCPLGNAIEAVSQADAEWFRRHPRATVFRRPPCRAEISTAAWLMGVDLPYGTEAKGRVVVTQLTPGVRTRDMSEVLLILTPGR